MFRHDKTVRSKSRFKKWLLIVIVALFLIAGGTVLAGMRWYSNNIAPLSSTDSSEKIFSVREGDTEAQIAQGLERAGIIRSAAAYQLYARLSNVHGSAQVGSYKLSASMSVEQISITLMEGKVAVDLITILPAQRLDQIKKSFIEAGYSQEEVDQALDPDAYGDHPALVDKPPLASLEGYLYPESFQRTANTPLKSIIIQSLDQTAMMFTDKIMQDLKASHNLDTFQALTLASIVEREVSNPDDRTKVAQVFLKRYREGIALGSDPTALYGALMADIDPSVSADTPYNTRIYAGLPPGPINNVSFESLKAVAYTASTDFLFFVSGDDGKTYFSRTQAEHEALTAQHCIELCKSY